MEVNQWLSLFNIYLFYTFSLSFCKHIIEVGTKLTF